jgi:hypothetical protein
MVLLEKPRLLTGAERVRIFITLIVLAGLFVIGPSRGQAGTVSLTQAGGSCVSWWPATSCDTDRNIRNADGNWLEAFANGPITANTDNLRGICVAASATDSVSAVEFISASGSVTDPSPELPSALLFGFGLTGLLFLWRKSAVSADPYVQPRAR